jgi:hypothetical protein
MKRTAVVLLLAVAACVDNRSSIEIGGRLSPDSATSCKFAPGNPYFLGPGVLDVAVSAQPTYQLVVKVTNNLVNPSSVSDEGFDPAKDWTAEAARVTVNPPDYVDRYGPSPALLPFQAQNVTPLDGQTTTKAGGASAQFLTAISGPLGAQLAGLVGAGTSGQIVLGISLQGHTKDGAYLQTGDWYFPVTVCSGCLAPPATCAAGETVVETSCFGVQDTAPVCAATTGG